MDKCRFVGIAGECKNCNLRDECDYYKNKSQTISQPHSCLSDTKKAIVRKVNRNERIPLEWVEHFNNSIVELK